MKTCSICGIGYRTTLPREDKLIYGCRNCHKGNWQVNMRDLAKVESRKTSKEPFYPYGNPLKGPEWGCPLKIVHN